MRSVERKMKSLVYLVYFKIWLILIELQLEASHSELDRISSRDVYWACGQVNCWKYECFLFEVFPSLQLEIETSLKFLSNAYFSISWKLSSYTDGQVSRTGSVGRALFGDHSLSFDVPCLFKSNCTWRKFRRITWSNQANMHHYLYSGYGLWIQGCH